MNDSPIRYAPVPQFCGECFNRVLADATANPAQSVVSVFCEHGAALLTAQIGEHNGERVIYAWNITGPCSPQQAEAGMRQAAKAMGAETVDNRRTVN